MQYDVEVGAPAELYARAIPAGAIAVGIVREKETGKTGALLRFQSGVYAQMNGSKIRPLDRGKVVSAMRSGIVRRLDPTEPLTTPERFAAAAKVAARAMLLARRD